MVYSYKIQGYQSDPRLGCKPSQNWNFGNNTIPLCKLGLGHVVLMVTWNEITWYKWTTLTDTIFDRKRDLEPTVIDKANSKTDGQKRENRFGSFQIMTHRYDSYESYFKAYDDVMVTSFWHHSFKKANVFKQANLE